MQRSVVVPMPLPNPSSRDAQGFAVPTRPQQSRTKPRAKTPSKSPSPSPSPTPTQSGKRADTPHPSMHTRQMSKEDTIKTVEAEGVALLRAARAALAQDKLRHFMTLRVVFSKSFMVAFGVFPKAVPGSVEAVLETSAASQRLRVSGTLSDGQPFNHFVDLPQQGFVDPTQGSTSFDDKSGALFALFPRQPEVPSSDEMVMQFFPDQRAFLVTGKFPLPPTTTTTVAQLDVLCDGVSLTVSTNTAHDKPRKLQFPFFVADIRNVRVFYDVADSQLNVIIPHELCGELPSQSVLNSLRPVALDVTFIAGQSDS